MKINKGDAPQFNKDELKRTLAKRNRKLVFDLHTLNKLDADQKVVVEMINGKCTNDWSLILKLTSEDASAGIKRETEKLRKKFDVFVTVIKDMVASVNKYHAKTQVSSEAFDGKLDAANETLTKERGEANDLFNEEVEELLESILKEFKK